MNLSISHGFRCSAADIEEAPVGEERWIGAANPDQPFSSSFGPDAQALELPARPARMIVTHGTLAPCGSDAPMSATRGGSVAAEAAETAAARANLSIWPDPGRPASQPFPAAYTIQLGAPT
jgi:hypothetical protein